ncbi:MAG: extracellular solute-binding protein [Lachnospiraceae bacterium]|nr:extracellular solute-binding protein [Lachnospiraceae bacterium]
MRKFLATMLAAAMTVSLVACGGGSNGGSSTAASDAPAAASTAAEAGTAAAEVSTAAEEVSTPEATAEPVSLTFWTYPVGGWGNSDNVDALLASFNEKYPEITVTMEYLDYTNGDDQVNTAIEGGNAPDLIMEGPERLVANWGARGLMVDLSDLFADPEAADIYANVTSACLSPDGNYYEYPLCMVAHCMAINKTIFEEADALQYLNLDNHTWTTEDFFKAVQAIYDSGHTNVAAIYCEGQGGDQGTRAIINNLYSGKFTNPEHTAYAVNSPENIQALEELYAQDGINFDPALVGGGEQDLLRNNTLAMAFCWNAASQTKIPDGMDTYGITDVGDEIIPMNFPTDDGKVELCGGIWGFGIFDNGDQAKIDAAKAFIRFMANENVKDAVLASGFFPAHSGVTDVYAGTETADVMAMFTKDFMPNLGDYYQVVPGWAQARTAWWNMLQRIGSGGDVATEVEAFETEANTAAGQ